MSCLDRIFTGRRERTYYEPLRARSRSRFTLACRRLDDAEKAMQQLMNLCVRPRLALVGEDSARVISTQFREEIELERAASAKIW